MRELRKMCDAKSLSRFLGGVNEWEGDYEEPRHCNDIIFMDFDYETTQQAPLVLELPSIEEDCADCPLVLDFEIEQLYEDEAARRIQKAWKRFSNPKKLVVVMKTTTTKSYSVVDGEVFDLNETTEKECTVYVRDKQGDVPLGHWNY